jgi:hypothetical protein
MGFEFKGLVGLFLKDASIVDYSFISVGEYIPEHSGIPNDFAIRWMQASYFIFGLLMPLSLMIALAVLWFVPLPLDRMRQAFVLCEVLNAWSTLDVYCIAIAASILEIQQFAAFIVGDSCDKINVYLEKAFMDQKLGGDDICFDVVAFLKGDAWMLFLAAGLILVVGVPSLMVGHAAVNMRLKHSCQAHLAALHLPSDAGVGLGLGEEDGHGYTEPLLKDEHTMDTQTSMRDSGVERASSSVGKSTRSSGLSKREARELRRAERSEAFWKWFRWQHNKLQVLYALAYLKLLQLEVRSVNVDEQDHLPVRSQDQGQGQDYHIKQQEAATEKKEEDLPLLYDPSPLVA